MRGTSKVTPMICNGHQKSRRTTVQCTTGWGPSWGRLPQQLWERNKSRIAMTNDDLELVRCCHSEHVALARALDIHRPVFFCLSPALGKEIGWDRVIGLAKMSLSLVRSKRMQTVQPKSIFRFRCILIKQFHYWSQGGSCPTPGSKHASHDAMMLPKATWATKRNLVLSTILVVE